MIALYILTLELINLLGHSKIKYTASVASQFSISYNFYFPSP